MHQLRHALITITTALCWGCGVSTLEQSDSERDSLSTPSVMKQDAGSAAVDAGVPVVVDAGPPIECESGDTSSCTSACGSDGTKACDGELQWGACRPPAESCDNGLDDDCDGRVDHSDPDCTPVVHTCEDAEGGGCNGDLGYGDRCSPADNENGCSASRFNAWCNRRNPEFPNIWDSWVHDWVSTRCDGVTDETGTQYSTWFCRSSSNDEFRCTTPLVLSFDSLPVRFERTTRLFAFTPGRPVQSDWPSAVTPWLALDVNGNGRIDDGSELFGSNTRTPLGTARHGFEALAALDGNDDGVIDVRDPSFGRLVIWRDANGDRSSQGSELTSLTAERVESLPLNFVNQSRCDLRGNCERERSGFLWRDSAGTPRQGSLVDVYLRVGPRVLALSPTLSPAGEREALGEFIPVRTAPPGR